MTDIPTEDFILALPDNSVIKTGLLAIGTNADAMMPTVELFNVISAYEAVQTEFNAGTLPDITTVGAQQILTTATSGEFINRTVRRQISFQQQFAVDSINPIIL
jgi:hypothetical protein